MMISQWERRLRWRPSATSSQLSQSQHIIPPPIICTFLNYTILLALLNMNKAVAGSPICNFESSCPQWSFVNSEELHRQQQALFTQHQNASNGTENAAPTAAASKPSSSNNNFYVVLSGGGNASNHYAYYQAMMPTSFGRHRSSATASADASAAQSPNSIVPMLISPHFERTSAQCELLFRYRILGARGAELLVATEQLSLRLLHPEQPASSSSMVVPAFPMEDEDEDWTRPTMRARFEPGNPPMGAAEPWAQARVSLGQFNFPTRIRVECHPSVQEQQQQQKTLEDEPMLSVECSVDDLQLINCEEDEWRPAGSSDGDVDCPEGRIPCRRPFGADGQRGRQICLRDDQLCDMHPDCADGEDELEQLHRCSQVPEGARCDFEDLRWLPAGCAHWRFFSNQAGGGVGQPANTVPNSGQQQQSLSQQQVARQPTALQHLVTLADAQTRRAGIPPGEYLHDGRMYRPGHFLFFSSYDHTQSGQHDIVYSFALSPAFPPLQTAAGTHCSLRFFYCQTGFSPFQVFLQRRDQPQELAKPVWAPPRDEHSREPCEWQRASVTIDARALAIGGEYSLKLSFAKLAGSLGSVAIDDLSMSPQCFANGARSSLLPSKLAISTDELDNRGEGEEQQEEGIIRWIVPNTGEYRLELSGASGGIFPGKAMTQSRDSWADRMVTNVRLIAGQQIGVMLGHRGECICDTQQNDQKHQQQLRREQAELRVQLCTVGSQNALEGMMDLLPGCGGGGASLFFIGNNPIAIAAGGGGDFPLRTILLDSDEQSTEANSGKGLSIGAHLGGNGQSRRKQCPEPCMDGHMMAGNWTQLAGGKCPKGSRWTLKGGKGGGGAACGPGGGGGAGYEGGAAGFLGPGSSGSSIFLPPNNSPSALGQPPLILAKSNPGQGAIRLFACPQRECPIRSNCTWAQPKEKAEPEARCICPDGRVVQPNGTCQIEPSIFNRLFGGNIQNGLKHPGDPMPMPMLLLLACLLLLILSILVSILCLVHLCRRCFRRRQKLHGCSSADVHELIAIASSGSGGGAPMGGVVETSAIRHYGISGNPIYESLNLDPLPQIPRHSLRVEKIIGHGAFGEVFEGWLLPDGLNAANVLGLPQHGNQPIKVAIKSLPVESARDFGDDFETEARLLSQFKHENIVTFFGVSFEQQPKYIVLEFLEGGDLKNFLRENRPRQDQEPLLKMGDLLGFALDVARGGQHLEATRFVHRDIAARNCLLTAKIGRRMVKIADFGMARDIYRNDYYRKGGKAFLPVRWMPPESFLDGLFTSKTDVWAFGVLLWEIFSMGYIPYSGRENHEVMRLVVAGDRLDPPIGIPTEVYDLMLCCWNTEAERRPKFSELITTFEAFLSREDLCSEPLPPIRHRLASERSVSGTPSMSRAGDPHPASTTSQATVSTALSSSLGNGGGGGTGGGGGGGASSTTTSTYESMPTAGDGVCRAVFPPYQSRQPDENGALIRLECPREGSADCSSPSSSSSSSQDETLHESAGTVKLRNCIIRKPPPLTVLKPTTGPSQMQQQKRPAVPTKPTPLVIPQTIKFSPAEPNVGNGTEWRRPLTTTPQFPTHHPHPQSHRNHSLPPLPSFGSFPASPAEHQRADDQDSGIASARSTGSADTALTLMAAALEERRRAQQTAADGRTDGR